MVDRALLLIIIIACVSCGESNLSYGNLSGLTMGTSYNIIAECSDIEELSLEIEQKLTIVNNAASTYEPQSIITLFNKDYASYKKVADSSLLLNDYFLENYDLSERIYLQSGGAFDPTIMPVVNYWGFGYTGREKVTEADSIKINSLLQSVGFNKLHKQGKVILKDNPLTELDFSGIAKGYGVDKIAEHLASKGLKNYYVEIGGEVFAKGVNSKGITWRTGIGIPSSEANPLEFQEILELENKGIATSGNYRNYYEANGKKVSHTINPENGLPERNELLSATIIAPTCAEADGYATACMVLGLQKAIRMIEDDDQLEGILIYGGENGIYQVYDSNKK